MGDILGVGLSHYPPLCGLDEFMADPLRITLGDDSIPAERRDPRNWEHGMLAEWSDDEGIAAAARHRAELVEAFRAVRRSIDEYAPDALLIIGDDQYENFREDVIPPYAVLAYPDVVARPWAQAHHSAMMASRTNVWGEPIDTEFKVRGRPDIGRSVATGLLQRGIDVAYAYKPLHQPGLSHAFLNAILFLDYDRAGFEYPVVPLCVNCYGSAVISRRGFMASMSDASEPDPPAPSPRRMMEVGAAIADVILASEFRIALVASSSWSHAFLCDATWRLRPDTDADRQLYADMCNGDYDSIERRTTSELENAGQHEILNWYVLFGAMRELERTLTWSTMIETSIFNSNKVFATYAAGPPAGERDY